MTHPELVQMLYAELTRAAEQYEQARYDFGVVEGQLAGQRIQIRAAIERLYVETTGYVLTTSERALPIASRRPLKRGEGQKVTR